MDPILCTVMPFPYSFIPQGWLPCDGRLVPVSQYTAVFSLIGTTYGGDGRTTFGLPNLNGASGMSSSVVAGQGAGPGLTPRAMGQRVGTDAVSLTEADLPPHSHALSVYPEGTNATAVPAAGDTWISTGANGYTDTPIQNPTTFAPGAVMPSGSGAPHENDQPNLSLVYCICVQGVYPSFD
ncbi:phage tail protein [Thioclava pacifica]|uniref:Phage tail collar domain-containing protein n=1 Tax=Thioclava pacifica DSM 10166 TaxID=1353537 RepID=A0A074JN26_9RHOB|nr:tail fiber protein [Thioclava pacifica]KEO50782.1 hypothetical protein TP2_14235 [Thioclava pacifica DSM 10166]